MGLFGIAELDALDMVLYDRNLCYEGVLNMESQH